MKIRNTTGLNVAGNIETAARRDVRKSSFAGEFERAAADNKRQNLLDITKEIFAQGEVVTQRCDIDELEKYKGLISSFFNELMEDSYSVNEDSAMFSKRKMYQNIKKINTDIERIASELLKTQKNQLEILGCVEDIRGLILDIFL
ncbi:MAG: YaaR family protein [Oscillospiraceae bacterium]|nr:YaaR family protein [Oscillospiraceae bacterium]